MCVCGQLAGGPCTCRRLILEALGMDCNAALVISGAQRRDPGLDLIFQICFRPEADIVMSASTCLDVQIAKFDHAIRQPIFQRNTGTVPTEVVRSPASFSLRPISAMRRSPASSACSDVCTE